MILGRHARGPRQVRSARGFTLLEVLVVLIIVSLISAVLMQGMSMVLRVRDSFGERMTELDRASLQRSLIRGPLEGLVADFSDGEDVFLGTAGTVKGLTTQPLFRRSGRPIPFSLTLEFDGRGTNTLYYREDRDAPIVLASWPGKQAYFRYIGDANGWVPKWPRGEEPVLGITSMILDVKPPQLPELIFLDTQADQELDYAVAIQGRRNRIPRDPMF